MTNNLFVDPAGFADALVFEIKDGIDLVLAVQRLETILDAIAGEDRGVVML